MTTTITANDEPTEIEADVDKRFSSIVVNLPVQQTGTGTPSPSNPRPFAMWTDVSLYVSDTEEADEPTLAIELPTPMYGGKVDMVRGEIATTYNSKESGTGWEMTEEGQFRCQVSAYNNGDETSTDVADLYAVHYETVSNKDAYDATDDLTCGLATIAGTTYLYVNDAQYTTLESFATHIAEEVFVFRAHIPMSDVTEPHIVYLPAGTSYVWADAGFVDLTASGTPPLSLTNSLGKPLKAWEVDVLPYQEGTGDPSPSNVRPIHGTDKLTICTGGVNMLATTATGRTYAGITYTVNTDGSVKVQGTSTSTSWLNAGAPTTHVPAGTYTISGGSSDTGLYIVGTFADGTTINNITIGGADGGTGRTFTLNQDCDIYWQISVGNGKTVDTVVYPMMAVGTSIADFVPYVAPSQTVLTLPQTVYTGTIGSEGGESRWGEVDLGTLEWTLSISGNFVANLTNKLRGLNMLCSARPCWNRTGTGTLPVGYIGASGLDAPRIYYKDPDITSVAELIQQLTGVQLVYELDNPVQFPLTAPTIPTPRGSATTWATAEDGNVDSMSVTYVGKA